MVDSGGRRALRNGRREDCKERKFDFSLVQEPLAAYCGFGGYFWLGALGVPPFSGSGDYSALYRGGCSFSLCGVGNALSLFS